MYILTIGLGLLGALCSYAGISLFVIVALSCITITFWALFTVKPGPLPGKMYQLRVLPGLMGVSYLAFL